jgi:hypothetical protein
MAKLTHDSFELTKCQLEITEFSHEVGELLRYIQHTPITFNQSNTSVQGDQYDNNTVLLNDYGRLTLGFAMDPQATNIAVYADAQIKGQKAGDKAVDSIAFFDSEGSETSRFNIERWHMEEFRIGPFNSKLSDNLEQSCTLDMEKFVRA